MSGARFLVPGAIALAAVMAACVDLPSDPDTPFSTAMRPRTSRVVVLGDTLRDSSGVAAPLRAIAFNLDGDSIAGATIRYFAASGDSVPVTVDPTTGYVIAKSERGFAGRRAILVANVGSLQTPAETIRVTLRPDALVPLDQVVDTVNVGRDTTRNDFQVRVRHTGGTGDLPSDTVVAGYEVRYSIIAKPPIASASDTIRFHWPSVRRAGTLVATTDTNGVASASLRIHTSPLLARQPRPYFDTVTVRVRVIGCRAGVTQCTRVIDSVDFVRVLSVPPS